MKLFVKDSTITLPSTEHECKLVVIALTDSVIIHQPQAPAFSAAGLLDYIVELVVSEDKVSIICFLPKLVRVI